MKLLGMLLPVLTAWTLGFAGTERPDYLVRIERQSETDLIRLLDAFQA